MVSTIGWLRGLEKSGLLDCITYISGVSGSTWATGLWMSLGKRMSEEEEKEEEEKRNDKTIVRLGEVTKRQEQTS